MNAQQNRNDFESYAFSKAHKTDAVLVFHRGELVYERYDRGYSEATKHIAWSMSKSVFAMAFGLLIDRRLVSLDDPLSNYLNDLPSRSHQQISIRNLLHMSSGLDWSEDYGTTPQRSQVISMLYRQGMMDMGSFALRTELKHRPGQIFNYSSGDSNILSKVFSSIVGDADVFLKNHFFAPLSITDVAWESDGLGQKIASSYLYAKPRDFLKIGSLFLDTNATSSNNILSSEWLHFLIEPGSPFMQRTTKQKLDWVYGGHVWLNRPWPQFKIRKPIPALPEDALFFLGVEGQFMAIVPSLQLVVLRLGEDFLLKPIDRKRFFALLMNQFFEHKNFNSFDDFQDKNQIDTRSFVSEIVNGITAKEYCSCRFIIGFSENKCKHYASKGFLLAKPSETGYQIFSGNRKAEFRNSAMGCLLDLAD